DVQGHAYVTGDASSAVGMGQAAFPTTPGAFQTANAGSDDGFVAKLDPAQSGAASLLYSTYLGGSDSEQGTAIAVDGEGHADVTGVTRSAGGPGNTFPTTVNAFQPANAGGFDAFVTKLNAQGSGLLYSTYLGGGFLEIGWGIAVDGQGDAYVTGQTNSIGEQ